MFSKNIKRAGAAAAASVAVGHSSAPRSASEMKETMARVHRTVSVKSTGSANKADTRSRLQKELATTIGSNGSKPYHNTPGCEARPPLVVTLDGTEILKSMFPHAKPSSRAKINKGGVLEEDRFTDFASVVKYFASAIMRAFNSCPSDSVHTVILEFDDPDTVAYAKAPTQAGRVEKHTSGAHDTFVKWLESTGETLDSYFGDRRFNRRYTCIDAAAKEERIRALGEVDTLEKMTELKAIKRHRTLEEMLVATEPICGPFYELVNNKKFGRPCLLRFIVKSLLYDADLRLKLKCGRRVIIGGAHGLLPEDIYARPALEALSAEEYHEEVLKISTTPVLILHEYDETAHEQYMGDAARFKRAAAEESLCGVIPSPTKMRVYPLHNFRHMNGEADYSMYFYVLRLSQPPFNYDSFTIKTVDSDASLFIAPLFLIRHWLLKGETGRMPHLYNDYTNKRGDYKMCAVHDLVMAMGEWFAEKGPATTTQLRHNQVERDPRGVGAYLAPGNAYTAHHEDAQWRAVDTAVDVGLSEKYYDDAAPGASHLIVAAILCGGDYVPGLAGMGFVKALAAMKQFPDKCLPLARRNRQGDGIEIIPEMVASLLVHMYAMAVPKKARLAVDPKALEDYTSLEELVHMIDRAVLTDSMRADLQEPELHMAECDDGELFAYAQKIGKLFFTNDELENRLATVYNYLIMLQEVGNGCIRQLPEERFGFVAADKSKPIHRYNIAFAHECGVTPFERPAKKPQ